MIVDIDTVERVLAETTEELILPRFGRLRDHEIRQKSSPNDLVTEVDHAVEERLAQRFKALLPGAGFIGEELAAANPAVTQEVLGGGVWWIVDPLDGTRNFVRGVEEFGTIVALIVDGVTEAGWIYAAPEGAALVGSRGEGVAWRGLGVQPNTKRRERLVGLRSLGWLPQAEQDRVRENMKANFDSRASHCSAYAYIHLSRGEVDFKISSLIHAWDHAAGALIVEETGGRAAYADDGSAYLPGPSVRKPLLVTSREADWEPVAGKLLN